jgi:hypothetical protein
MLRKQFYLEPRQNRQLKHLARRSGKTEAQIIREALERTVQETEREQDRLRIWEGEMAFIRQRMALAPVHGGGRTWKREHLYDRPYPGRH